jgi:hypothetical protein
MSAYAMLSATELAADSKTKDAIVSKYLALLSADRENLLMWVMRSARIAELYNRIPAKYM